MEERTSPSPLSERELELLTLVAKGASNQQIARELFISVNTVKVHLRNIFDKLGVESRTEAAMLAVREGWIQLEGIPGPAPAIPEAPAAPPPTPISLPQRVFLVVSLLIVLGAAFLLPSRAHPSAGRPASPFAERAITSSLLPTNPEASRWSQLPAMPLARGRQAAVWHAGKIYVIAGDTNDGITGAADVYDTASRQWSTMPYKPLPVSNVAAVLAAGRIWVPGGFLSDGHVTDRVEAYNLETGQWEEGPSLPQPLCGYALAVAGGRLYLFGGANEQGYTDTALRFDPETGGWQSLPPLSSPRAFAGAAVLDDRIYVVGGYDGQRELNICQAFSPAALEAGQNPWEDCPPLSLARGGLGLVAAGKTLYAIGGGWQSYLAYNEQFDAEKGEWTHLDTPIEGEWRNLAAVSDGKTVYALGGWNGQYLDSLWAYQAIVTIFLPITP
ncbi:MAG: Kelch repeat-containing protein [Anaerolineae bacterium]